MTLKYNVEYKKFWIDLSWFLVLYSVTGIWIYVGLDLFKGYQLAIEIDICRKKYT